MRFFDWLSEKDPQSGQALSPGDSQRVLRAAEVLEATGKPIGQWRAEARTRLGLERFHRITLVPPREPLYAACDARFLTMLDQGALDEVAAFVALGLEESLPVNKALGVPELRSHLVGERDLDDAVAAAQQTTRNYAKRQLTWFRNQIKPRSNSENQRDFRLDAQYSETFLPEIVSFVQKER